MRITHMTEPASTTAAGIALYKLGLLGAAAGVLVAVVVMAMTLPKTVREFCVAMISTLVASFAGGAFIVRWFDLGSWANDDIGLVALFGICFVAGLPAWVMVRGWFAYTEARKGRSLLSMIKELRAAAKGE